MLFKAGWMEIRWQLWMVLSFTLVALQCANQTPLETQNASINKRCPPMQGIEDSSRRLFDFLRYYKQAFGQKK